MAFENDKLLIRWGKYTFRTDHFHFDTFTAVPVEPKDNIVSFDRSTFDVQFRLGTNGAVDGMRFLDQEFQFAKKEVGADSRRTQLGGTNTQRVFLARSLHLATSPSGAAPVWRGPTPPLFLTKSHHAQRSPCAKDDGSADLRDA